MSVAWVACSVRGRAMTRRRAGKLEARALAASPTLEAAVRALARGPYGHDVLDGQTLAQAQRAVVETVLWNVRVLAGWAPREGVSMLRVLLGAVEIANVEDHLAALSGAQVPPPYRLGALATSWARLARTSNLDEAREVLAASPWGDPGVAAPREIGLAMRTTLADRIVAAVPDAARWASAATALLVARQAAELHELPSAARLAATRVIGAPAVASASLSELAAALPAATRWALAGIEQPSQLWQAEARWWTHLERDAVALAKSAVPGPRVLIGAVAMMAADGWRVRAALELAARGGGPLEVFDAVA